VFCGFSLGTNARLVLAEGTFSASEEWKQTEQFFQILDRKHPFFTIYFENECFTFSFLGKWFVYSELTFVACWLCFGSQAQNTHPENGFDGNFRHHSPTQPEEHLLLHCQNNTKKSCTNKMPSCVSGRVVRFRGGAKP
jgi:hypothetical protein